MCAKTAAEQQAESPSRINLLLLRLQEHADEGQAASLSPYEISLLIELRDQYYRLKRRHEGQVAIERAKEIVADERRIRLQDAMKYMQGLATSMNKTLEETVESILIADRMRREREAEMDGVSTKRRGA